jgi:hypothetical protein
MSSGREKEFDQYARECVRLAEGVEDPDLREKLLNRRVNGCKPRWMRKTGRILSPSQVKVLY